MGALYGHRAIGCHPLRLQKESIFCEVCPARPSLLTSDLRPFDPALDPAVTLLRLLGARGRQAGHTDLPARASARLRGRGLGAAGVQNT